MFVNVYQQIWLLRALKIVGKFSRWGETAHCERARRKLA
jgi:hypothetical protein